MGTNSAKLSEAMYGQAAELGLSVAFESILCDRYSIASARERGCLCFVDKRIAASFATLGYRAIPRVADHTERAAARGASAGWRRMRGPRLDGGSGGIEAPGAPL